MQPARKGDDGVQLTKGRTDRWEDNDEDCQVCMTAFDDTVQRPRTLPCGHTFCTPCINGLKEQGQVTCPTCRVAHAVPEAGQFPISYTLEAFIRRVRAESLSSRPPRPGKDTGKPALSPVTEPGQNCPVGLSKAIRPLLQEQEAKIQAVIRISQEVHAQLDQYQTTLISWGERQQHLEDGLQALVDQSKNARILAREDESQVAARKEQVQQGEQQLHALMQVLRTVNTDQEAGAIFVDVARRTDEERQSVEECQKIFPDLHTVTTLSKMEATSRAVLKVAQAVEGDPAGAAGDPNFLADPTSTIMERLHGLLAPTLEIEDLRTLTQSTRNLLQDGLVFASHKTEGRSRHARISFANGCLYLHSLQDQPLTSGAVTLQMDEVTPAAPPCMAFLDLAWPSSETCRVLIKLSPDTPMGRQFVMLCTGQRGPCYANTRLYKVHHKGKPGEWVGGGDYDKNNGKGGDALLPGLDKGKYRQSNRAGAVFRVNRDVSDWNARFGIYTRDCQSAMGGVFGEVVEGLEGVVAAAQHSPIKDVIVVDCGVVLWA